MALDILSALSVALSKLAGTESILGSLEHEGQISILTQFVRQLFKAFGTQVRHII